MSEFYIYNAAKERIGVLQNEESVQWLENFKSPGEVKIIARATADNLDLLIDGNRVYNTDSNTVAKISYVEIIEGVEDNSIIARGELTAKLLDQRVVMATENVTNIESGMYAIYSKNKRGLPVEIGSAAGYPDSTETEITWGSVLDAQETLAQSSDFGFSVVFDPETAVETFKVYKGVDRTNEDGDNYVGYFGTDAGNLYSIQISKGTSDFKNIAVVAGAGEGAERAVWIAGAENVQGEQRRELYVDARDIQREYQIATPTGEVDERGNPTYEYTKGTYTDAEYNALLDSRGLEKLAECMSTLEISCEVTQDNLQFGKDYFLGDRMPVKLPEYGIYASAVISASNTVYENTGKTITVTLSDFRLEEYK